MLIKVGDYIFPAHFIVLDIEENWAMPTILARPFVATSRTLLDFETCEMILRVEDKK